MARKFATNIDVGQNEIINVALQVLSAAPGSPVQGQVYFDSTKNQIGIYTGSAWEYDIVTIPVATTGVVGAIQLAGDLGGTDTSPTVVGFHLAANGNAEGFRITSLGTPSAGTDAATKDYVDAAIFGLKPTNADLATTAALPTYTGGGTGVLTGSVNGALSVDGTVVQAGQVILVKNQSGAGAGGAEDNGLYTVTTVGSGSVKYVLTRQTDAEGDATTWTDYVGQLVAVSNEGSTLGDTIWMSAVAPGGTLNTTQITYVQIQSGLSVTGDSTYTTKVGSALELILAADVSSLPANGAVATAITGGGHIIKSALTGDGTTTSFTITHNLGTKQLLCQGQINSSGAAAAPIELDWAPGTTNTVVITFPTAPGAGVSYFVTIVG